MTAATPNPWLSRLAGKANKMSDTFSAMRPDERRTYIIRRTALIILSPVWIPALAIGWLGWLYFTITGEIVDKWLAKGFHE